MNRFIATIILIFCVLFSGVSNADYGDWEAKVIDISGLPVVHYINNNSVKMYHNFINFDASNFDDLNKWEGISSIHIKQGKLYFRVNKRAKFIWGDFNLDKPKNSELFIAKNWSDQAWPFIIEIKIKQSLKKSRWKLVAGYLKHGHRRLIKSIVYIKGTNDHIVQFNMGAAKRNYIGFRLSTDTPRNDISLDWIKILRPSIKKIFRYKFNVKGKPIANNFLFSANGKTKVFINGVKIGTYGGKHPYSRMLNRYKNIRQIKQGENELCITVEGYSAYSKINNPGRQFFFLEGMVIDKQGNIVKIKTDKTWQGAYGNRGCTKSDIKFKKVVIIGDVKNTWPILTSMKPYERFGDRPYLGRIRLGYKFSKNPIFLEDRDVIIKFNILGRYFRGSKNQFINYQLKPWTDDRRVTNRTLISGRLYDSDDSINFHKLKSGVYELFITYYKNGKSVDERRQELVVIGKIKQNKIKGFSYIKGMKLRKTDYIKFSSQLKRKILCGYKKNSKYLNKSFDIYSTITNLLEPNLQSTGLELSPMRTGWCSIKFKIGKLYKPHLIEVEYPQNKPINMVFVVSEKSRFPNINNIGKGGGIVRLSTGISIKGNSGRSMKTSRFIYWPNRKNATFTVVNSGRNFIDRGEVKSITVSQITNDLPAFSIPITDNKNSFVGPFVERVDRTTPRLFYGGILGAKFSHELMGYGYFSGYYNAWYSTISNLIKYMKFSGQNTYFAGIYMYYGGWFPSKYYQGQAETGVNYFSAGWENSALELMARMFEENGLKLVLGVQFIGSRNLSKLDNLTDAQVLDGSESIRFINKNGRQVHGFQNQGYNFLTKKVNSELLGLAGEIGKKFGKYKAIKGITWMREPEFPLAPIATLKRTPLDIGYGDYTISLYKKQTNSLLPTSPAFENRFNYRYQWIMHNEKDKWIQWRCKKVYETDKKIQNILSKYRKDWKVWKIVPRPVPELIKQWGDGEINMLNVYRYSGIDPKLYEKDDKLSLMFINDIGAGNKYRLRHQLSSVSDTAEKFYDDMEKNKIVEKFSMFAHIGFILETRIRTKKKWPWHHLNVVGYSVPSKDGLYSKFLQFIVGGNPRAVAIGWSDAGHFEGNEQDIRRYWLTSNTK